jgi:hypothetical protein
MNGSGRRWREPEQAEREGEREGAAQSAGRETGRDRAPDSAGRNQGVARARLGKAGGGAAERRVEKGGRAENAERRGAVAGPVRAARDGDASLFASTSCGASSQPTRPDGAPERREGAERGAGRGLA